MLKLVGILALLTGVIFPMGMLYWLNGRMRHQPALLGTQVKLILVVNGTLPVGLVALGLALLSDRLWTSMPIQLVIAASLITALVAFILLRTAATPRPGRGANHDHG